MQDRAADRFEIVVRQDRTVKGRLRTLALALMQLITAGGAPSNPGGRTIASVDRRTGQTLVRHFESLGEDDGLVPKAMRDDLESCSVEEFLARWADGPPV